MIIGLIPDIREAGNPALVLGYISGLGNRQDTLIFVRLLTVSIEVNIHKWGLSDRDRQRHREKMYLW
mgnify:FL=1